MTTTTDRRWNTGSRWGATTVETVSARLAIIQAKGSEVHVGDIICGAIPGGRRHGTDTWAPMFRVTAQGDPAGGDGGPIYQRWETTSCVASGNDYTDEMIVNLEETLHIVDTLTRA